MSLASSQQTELSLAELLLILWLRKWFLLVGLVAGLLLAYPATMLLPDTINRTVTLTIYPSGTPTDTASDIQNQLTALLARKNFTAFPSRTGSNLIISMPYKATDLGNADGKFVMLAKFVSDYRVRLLAKVSGAYFDLQERYGAEGRADTLVQFRAFQDGVKDGSIDPVRVSVVEDDSRSRGKMIIFFVLPISGLMAGFGVAILTSAWASLKKRQPLG